MVCLTISHLFFPVQCVREGTGGAGGQNCELHYRVMGKIAPPEGTKMNYESTSKRQSMSPHKAAAQHSTAQHTHSLIILSSNSCVPLYLVPKLPSAISVKIYCDFV